MRIARGERSDTHGVWGIVVDLISALHLSNGNTTHVSKSMGFGSIFKRPKKNHFCCWWSVYPKIVDCLTFLAKGLAGICSRVGRSDKICVYYSACYRIEIDCRKKRIPGWQINQRCGCQVWAISIRFDGQSWCHSACRLPYYPKGLPEEQAFRQPFGVTA